MDQVVGAEFRHEAAKATDDGEASRACDHRSMRWCAGLGLLLVTACGAPLQTGVFLESRFEVPDALVSSEVPAEEMRYLIWFPPGYAEGDETQLVVFLHGSGDDDYDSRWLTSYGLPAALTFDELPTEHSFVLLAPQATPGTSWAAGRQPETVLALIDEVVGRHGLDADAISLTGLSMGGYGAWHLATLDPELFRAVASVSGSGYGSTVLPGDLDVCALADVELRGYHGSDDMISLLDLNRAVVEGWEAKCGADLDFRVLDGLGHFATFEQVYRDPAFYDWLLGPSTG
jgi:predicted peptidase